MALFKSKKPAKADPTALPRHIAIIMDGNGRWAERRGLPRKAGHAAGSETFRKIATYCRDIGVTYLTVYAFSTENWKRSEDEVSAIMGLLEKYLYEAIERTVKDRVRFRFIGDQTMLSDKLKELIGETERVSADFKSQVNICLNYGGRDEIIRAAERFAEACVSGEASPSQLNEEMFSRYCYTNDVPDPDLVIRPGGELRISNFLLWQSAYSEYYFTDTLWPDFGTEELDRAILSYQSRTRRFGGAK